MGGIVIIGDCIIDAVMADDGSSVPYPGGAGLNLAVGVSRLGIPSTLIARLGADKYGSVLRRYLRDKGVGLIATPTVDFTGVAYSHRVNGEPTYTFNPAVFRRRIAITPKAEAAIAGATIAAVNSFPFQADDQIRPLVEAFARHGPIVVVDPNPRPALVADVGRFRDGLALASTVTDLLKISDEDIRCLYGENVDLARLFVGRIDTLLVTRGADGASVLMKYGFRLDMPASPGEGPVVDTMGAGDAALAGVLAFVYERRRLPSAADWPVCLRRAMDIAAATCRSGGAELRLPESLGDHAA
jgi:fructokinase